MNQVERSLSPWRTLARGEDRETQGRLDLLSLPWLRPIFENPWPLFIARSITLAGFVFTILAGLIGTPVGSHNFAIIFVWIAWWTALKLVFIPLGGRSWCSVCPLPLPGEWLQRGNLIQKRSPRRIAGFHWPKKLRGAWLQAALFLVIGIFSAVTLTDARITAWILVGLFGMAAMLSLLFEGRAFCKYICPIGGFTALYARTSPIELRVKNVDLCLTHQEKTCYLECPWGYYPVAFRDSAQCGLCMECLRACPKDNIALRLRPFGTDLKSEKLNGSLDETFLALVMLGTALSFSAIFNGPWGSLKSAAYAVGSQQWLVYSMGFLALNLLFLPALFVLSVWCENLGTIRARDFRKILKNRAIALTPLGLFAWIAFTISFALPKFGYVLSVLSDPFGWGWELLGTANLTLSIDTTSFSSILQILSLLIGLAWSLEVYRRQTVSSAARASGWWREIPVPLFLVVYTNLLLWLLVG